MCCLLEAGCNLGDMLGKPAPEVPPQLCRPLWQSIWATVCAQLLLPVCVGKPVPRTQGDVTLYDFRSVFVPGALQRIISSLEADVPATPPAAVTTCMKFCLQGLYVFVQEQGALAAARGCCTHMTLQTNVISACKGTVPKLAREASYCDE